LGNVPIIKLNKVVSDHAADVWVKLKGGNPRGSYKDRMALAIIEGAEIWSDLKPGMTVVEYTGDSTGSGLLTEVKKHPESIHSFGTERMTTANPLVQGFT